MLWLVGVEGSEAEPLPPVPGAGVQGGDDDRAACGLLVQLDRGSKDVRREGATATLQPVRHTDDSTQAPLEAQLWRDRAAAVQRNQRGSRNSPLAAALS